MTTTFKSVQEGVKTALKSVKSLQEQFDTQNNQMKEMHIMMTFLATSVSKLPGMPPLPPLPENTPTAAPLETQESTSSPTDMEIMEEFDPGSETKIRHE